MRGCDASGGARPGTPARSTRSRPGCCSSSSGGATRVQRFLTGLPKTYRAKARLGWRSSTGDPDGELTRDGPLPDSLELPTGRVRQRLPMTSAVRVGGERLYRKAHRGEVVETPEREVDVYRAELLESDGDTASYEIECSAGTYIRTLVETLEDAYCCELRRTAIGPFDVEDAGREIEPRAARRAGPGRRGGAALVPPIEVTSLPDAEPRPRKVAIGTFDGVHLGHRAVIEGSDTVLTFDPHPLEILHPAALPKLIMPFKVKRDVIEGLGVRELVVIPFDEEFTKVTAEEFVEEVLDERLAAESVSVGENFRFGAKAQGDPEMLAAHPEFETRVVPLVEVDGETVSSTRIRALVAAGEMDAARRCLGAPFMVEGTVVEGDQRGRELGFPTANIVPDDRLVIPGHGVYAAFANGVPAAVNVGVRPTFETGRGVLIETYLIDHEEDLYGSDLRVAFVERLRGEKRFAGVEDLIAQMRIDVEDARRVCAGFTGPE